MNGYLSIVPEPLLLRRPVNLRARAPQSLDRLPAVGLAPYHWNPDQVFIKRVIDILVSALLALLSPLFGLLALAIRLTSSGPVFYHWRVIGHLSQGGGSQVEGEVKGSRRIEWPSSVGGRLPALPAPVPQAQVSGAEGSVVVGRAIIMGTEDKSNG